VKGVEGREEKLNPVRDATAVRSAPKRRRFPDATELERFLRESAQDRYATFWALAIQSGARLGELLGLRWDCVDFRRGIIRIERQWRAESLKLTNPKSQHSIREVTLSGAATRCFDLGPCTSCSRSSATKVATSIF